MRFPLPPRENPTFNAAWVAGALRSIDFNASGIDSPKGHVMDRETVDEIKRHFSVVAEELRSEVRTVAEGLQGFRDEVSAEFRAVREEISEVKAMIRLSFGELDRRMRSLESDVASLRTRLEKLEARSGN